MEDNIKYLLREIEHYESDEEGISRSSHLSKLYAKMKAHGYEWTLNKRWELISSKTKEIDNG